jgi:tetratricopeptide (TPR) repeat protein
MPKRILGDLYKLTQFEDIKEETGESLKELDYCDKLNTAKLLYKVQHYGDAFQLLEEVNNSLPDDKKLSRTDLERIKYALNNNEFEKAFTIYSQAFKELCP